MKCLFNVVETDQVDYEAVKHHARYQNRKELNSVPDVKDVSNEIVYCVETNEDKKPSFEPAVRAFVRPSLVTELQR